VSRIAITREVGAGIGACELVHLARRPIDVEAARVQHRAYEAALRDLGCTVHTLAADATLPDSVFVEDAAVVLDEVAVSTRPGAPSRRAETAAVADALSAFRPLLAIEAPATVDGGDVLRIERTLYVGLTERTNAAAIDQLATALERFGYRVHAVPVHGCLHLKSAATLVAPGIVLCNRRWVDPSVFAATEVLDVDPAEPYAANGLLVGDRVIYPTSFPATRRRLERRGVALLPLDVSELQKAEGAVTCCSLVFEDARTEGPAP
jgi:dimethylargininase